MMPNMMFGMDAYMFFWVVLVTIVCLLLIGAGIWFAVSWSKKQWTPTTQSTPQPRDTYEEYEQGYRSQQQPPETYQEGGQYYSYPQNEQGEKQYQEMEQLQQ
jgi:hypothetical protein